MLSAQRPKTPALGDILQRLDDNLRRYDTLVPSFLCDEHALSQVEPSVGNQDTITDSAFRLRRTQNPGGTTALEESREIRKVNGKPATNQDIQGPSLLSGVFEGGLAVVSLKQTACMNYTLQRVDKNHSTELYIIRFATVLTPQNTAECLLQEDSKGSVLIDPVNMQITHLELTTPRHTIIPGDVYSSPVVGKRVLTVDYAPVVLGGQTFWMPSTITSRSTGGSGTFHPTEWSFRASYRNYHKLEVKSRIVPAGGAPSP